MRRYRAALAFALAGCAADPRAVYTAAVAHAQDRWAAACGVRPAPASVVVYCTRATVECGRTVGAVACTDSDGHVWLAGSPPATAPLDGVVLHELGHVLGAHHLPPGVAGVMVDGLSTGAWRPCITQADLDAVGRCSVSRPECGN